MLLTADIGRRLDYCFSLFLTCSDEEGGSLHEVSELLTIARGGIIIIFLLIRIKGHVA